MDSQESKDKKIKILLIEDDKLAQKMAVIILSQLNCTVTPVSNAGQAREWVNKGNFDLIFADVSLPDGDGFSLVKEIRTISSSNQQVPIIMLSAHSDNETISQSLAAGASDFFVKPLNKEKGLDILKKYLTAYFS